MAKKAKKRKRKKGEIHESLDFKKAIVLLSLLRNKHQIEIDNINDNLFKGLKRSSPKKYKLIIDIILKMKGSLPIEKHGDTLVWEGPFEKYSVGRRVRESYKSKALLAEKVVDMLISQSPPIHSIFIGAGSSALAVTRELIQRKNKIKTLADIYTNNVPALNELIPYGDLFRIRVPEGRIIMEDGTIISDSGIASLKEGNYDAAVVSFLGVKFDEGFSSDGEKDKNEKMMNLRPDNCSTIYIVLCWEKFGSVVVGDIFTTIEEGIDQSKKYIIVTDPPQNWERKEQHKVDELKKWSSLREKGVVKFEFVEGK